METMAVAALPIIDSNPTEKAMADADALVRAEIDLVQTDTLHPSLPPMHESKLSDLVEREFERLASGTAKESGAGIDLSRYEAPDPPENSSDKEAWAAVLRQAYAAAEYLRSRETNLGLLEAFGKNAWLVGNARLEDELKSLERDLEAAKLELEAVEQARRSAQVNAAGELQGLDETWRAGVGRMIEAQAAGERLRMQILEKRRAMTGLE